MGSGKQNEIDRLQAEADRRTVERGAEEKREVIDAALHKDPLFPSKKSTNLTRQNLLLLALGALMVALLVGYIF